jgi:hypothetical protein
LTVADEFRCSIGIRRARFASSFPGGNKLVHGNRLINSRRDPYGWLRC